MNTIDNLNEPEWFKLLIRELLEVYQEYPWDDIERATLFVKNHLKEDDTELINLKGE